MITKQVVLDIMRYNILPACILSLTIQHCFAQKKEEREYRITKEELPKNAISLLHDYLETAKRIRYYKEIDGNKSSFEVKFKKNKIFYSIEFNEQGLLEDVEFIIDEKDIPLPTLKKVQNHLSQNFDKTRIKKIQRQYPNTESSPKIVLNRAFENSMIPSINYEIIIASRDKDGFHEYEVTYDSMGNHLLTRKSIVPKYDHVLFQ